jgi:hypothetical protein
MIIQAMLYEVHVAWLSLRTLLMIASEQRAFQQEQCPDAASRWQSDTPVDSMKDALRKVSLKIAVTVVSTSITALFVAEPRWTGTS